MIHNSMIFQKARVRGGGALYFLGKIYETGICYGVCISKHNCVELIVLNQLC